MQEEKEKFSTGELFEELLQDLIPNIPDEVMDEVMVWCLNNQEVLKCLLGIPVSDEICTEHGVCVAGCTCHTVNAQHIIHSQQEQENPICVLVMDTEHRSSLVEAIAQALSADEQIVFREAGNMSSMVNDGIRMQNFLKEIHEFLEPFIQVDARCMYPNRRVPQRLGKTTGFMTRSNNKRPGRLPGKRLKFRRGRTQLHQM